MEECPYCTFNEDGEGEPFGDMWLKRRYGEFLLYAPVGESFCYYCPQCGRDLFETER